KPKPEKYDCTTCGRTLASSSFPNHLATGKCVHLINTCKRCTKIWIATQLDTVTYDKLSSPECPEVLSNKDVNRLAAKDVHAKYDKFERAGIAVTSPGWRWCLNPKCREGQVHQSLLDSGHRADGESNKKGKAKPDEDDICTCKACGTRACVPCDRPYHEGETCAQYQGRKERQTKMDEEATEKTIKDVCKKCPNPTCEMNIQRSSGCDKMTCTQCRTGFCWVCLATY
ncbi:hypothetical protein BAUCODRAFT_59544, partial [Baudoinia panamericana UAMH 10762]